MSNEFPEIEEEQDSHFVDMQPQLEQVQEGKIDDDHGALEEDIFAPNNEDGMIMIPEENIVSDDEEFVETDNGEHDEEDHVPEVAM